MIVNVILYLIVIKDKTITFKVFTVYLVLMLIIHLYSSYLANLGQNNLFLSHYYFLIQYLLLSFFYYKSFEKKIIKKSILHVSIIVIGINSFYYIYNPSIYFKFNLVEIITSSIPLIIFNILYLFNSLINNKDYFYINSGIFIYLISSTLFFVSGNYLTLLNREIVNVIWKANSIIYIIYQLLIILEWYFNFRKSNNYERA